MNPVTSNLNLELEDALRLTQGDAKDSKLIRLAKEFLRIGELNNADTAVRYLTPRARPVHYLRLSEAYCKSGDTTKAAAVADGIVGYGRREAFEKVIHTMLEKNQAKEAADLFFDRVCELTLGNQYFPFDRFFSIVNAVAKTCTYEETVRVMNQNPSPRVVPIRYALEGFIFKDRLDEALRLFREHRKEFKAKENAKLIAYLACSDRTKEAHEVIDSLNDWMLSLVRVELSGDENKKALDTLLNRKPSLLKELTQASPEGSQSCFPAYLVPLK